MLRQVLHAARASLCVDLLASQLLPTDTLSNCCNLLVLQCCPTEAECEYAIEGSMQNCWEVGPEGKTAAACPRGFHPHQTHKVMRLVLHSTLHAPSWLSK